MNRIIVTGGAGFTGKGEFLQKSFFFKPDRLKKKEYVLYFCSFK